MSIFTDKNIFHVPKVFQELFGKYRLQISLLAFLGFVNSLVEGIGISAVIPLFSFVSYGGNKSNDFITVHIEKLFTLLHLQFTLKYLLIFITSLFIIKLITLFFVSYLTTKIVTNYEVNMRIELFSKTLKSNWAFLSSQKIGHLDQMLSTNIANSSAMFFCFSAFILALGQLTIYTIIAFNISASITIMAILVGLVTFFALKPLFSRSKMVATQAEILNRESSHYTNENVLGMKTVKSFSKETSVVNRARQYFEKTKALNLRAIVYKNLMEISIQAVGISFVLTIFAFFYKTAQFNFAAFVVMVYAVNQLFLQIQSIQNQTQRILSSIPYLSSVINYRDKVQNYEENISGKNDFALVQQLCFYKVNFSYDKKNSVLTDLSFIVRKNEMVGLIGPSGAGKTTVVDLLLRLYIPDSGKITLDGKNIGLIDVQKWRDNISYVSQDAFLMNDSVINNIRFYNENIGEEEVIAATKSANCYDFIQHLSDGFDTVIGDRGTKLSGGERQRIILARALAKKPQILILDEATSALDNESELLIQNSIDNLRGKLTVLAIAHRLSTVVSMDKLIVVSDGKIIEEGPPTELLKDKESYFFKVYNLRR